VTKLRQMDRISKRAKLR